MREPEAGFELQEISTVPAPDGRSLEFQISQPSDYHAGPVDAKSRSSFRIFAILTALYLSLFIAALDATIVSSATVEGNQ